MSKESKKKKEDQEIILVEGNKKLALVDPSIKIEFAKKASKILMETMECTNAIIEIQGNKYLKFEGWQMLANFFGLSVGIDFFAPIEDEDGRKVGYKAKAVVYLRDGTIIGSAWGIATRKEKGRESKASSQLLGLAQTRACVRALRQIMGWVASLGGFKEISAEEIEEKNNEENLIEEN